MSDNDAEISWPSSRMRKRSGSATARWPAGRSASPAKFQNSRPQGHWVLSSPAQDRPAITREQGIGKIDITKEFDGVLLALMEERFNATAIHEADRAPVADGLTAPGSRSRDERGALGVGRFKSIGRQVWLNGARKGAS